MTHDLKTWPEPFHATYRGDKPWEFRKDDRNFEVGDYLVLRLWCPDEKKFLDSEVLCEVTYKLSGPSFGIPEGLLRDVNLRFLDARNHVKTPIKPSVLRLS
jgi:hypothetical protein